MKRIHALLSLGLCLFTLPAVASLNTTTPFLPPGGSYYVNPPSSPIIFSNSTELASMNIRSITLDNLAHRPGEITGSGYFSDTPGISNYWDTFDSTLTGTATIDLLSGGTIYGTVNATGSVFVTVQSYTNGTTGGPFTTAMSLDWTNVVISWDSTAMSLFLQCSNAPGGTTITSVSQDNYLVDSYFDVWTEISFDGTEWIPAGGGPIRMSAVPEPAGPLFLLIGALGLALRYRRC